MTSLSVTLLSCPDGLGLEAEEEEAARPVLGRPPPVLAERMRLRSGESRDAERAARSTGAVTTGGVDSERAGVEGARRRRAAVVELECQMAAVASRGVQSWW